MKEIILTQNKIAIVSDEDYDWLSQYRWQVKKTKCGWYAATPGYIDGRRVTTFMHKRILNIPFGDKKTQGDHKNHNTLDNRRENLRICSHSQNGMNRGKGRNNTSGYKGVSWGATNKKWKVTIQRDKKSLFIGYFDDKIEAAKAYDNAALELHGEFANTNF